MRMNKHLLRISICLWLCLFTFISTWGDEVSFNPVTTTSENAYFELTSNDMVNVTDNNVVTGIKGASPKNFTISSKNGETCPQGFDFVFLLLRRHSVNKLTLCSSFVRRLQSVRKACADLQSAMGKDFTD